MQSPPQASEGSAYGESTAEDQSTSRLSPLSSIRGQSPAPVTKQSRRVSGRLPLSAWLVVIAEACERFAYNGLAGPLQNFLQNRPDNQMGPGGLGLTQSAASRINQCFVLWTYLTPLGGAVIADQHLGRLNTILLSNIFYTLGLVCLFLSAQTGLLSWELSLGVLLLAMFLLGTGSGGIKPNVNAFIAEQYTKEDEITFEQKSKSYIIVDRDLTIQRIFALFYICINLSSLSPLITTQIEQSLGFASAFAVPLAIFPVGFGILLLSRKRLVSRVPEGSALLNAIKIMYIALRNERSSAAAKSTRDASSLDTNHNEWDDAFVDSLANCLSTCRLFVVYPVFWMCWIQMLTNFISQAHTMETHGLPNDILININCLTVIVLLPILEHVVYPYFRTHELVVSHVSRITLGFLIMSLAMAYTALVQHLIYSSPPCFNKPLARDCLDGMVPNKIHVGLQAPSYLLVAIAEILIIPTGFEYAFSSAPASMKSIVMAVFVSTVAVGAFLAAIVSQLAVDPLLIWMYIGLGTASFATGIFLWTVSKLSRHSGREMLRSEDDRSEQLGLPSESSPLLPGPQVPSAERRRRSL